MVREILAETKRSAVINGPADGGDHQDKPKVKICRREQLDAVGREAIRDAIDAGVNRNFCRMDPLITGGKEQIRGDLVLDFDASLLCGGIVEFLHCIAEWELNQW